MRVRVTLPVISTLMRARSFFRHPLRFVARRLFRFTLGFGIFGLSFGLGGLRFMIRLPFISFIFGGRKRKSGGGGSGGGKSSNGGKSKSGGSRDSNQGGGQSGGEPRDGSGRPTSDGPPRDSSGRAPRGPSDNDGAGRERDARPRDPDGNSGERRSPVERATDAMGRLRDRLRERRERSRDEEDREVRDEDPDLRAHREREEREEREARDRVEREARERQEREREARDRQEREERDRVEREAREREEREERDRVEREAREREEREERDRVEREARERQEREEPDRQERDKAVTDSINRPTPELGRVLHRDEFQIDGPLPLGQRVLLEASAGTGKTFSLTALVVRYVVEKDLKLEQLLMVTFTKAAAGEMRERTRSKLSEALQRLKSSSWEQGASASESWLRPILACDESERQIRMDRLRQAIASVDSATITTIHGFFQQTLKEVGLRSADLASAEIAEDNKATAKALLRDDLVRKFSEGTSTLLDALPEKTPSDLESRLLEILDSLESNISAVPAPWASNDPLATEWANYINWLRHLVTQHRRESGNISFDDLITGLRDLLGQENQLSQEVILNLRRRYRLVLIDEFQDTDDTQWTVFSQIFDQGFIASSRNSTQGDNAFLAMIMVGDPKQAIYRFRGADIAAYLRAVEDPDLVRFEMKRNHRTDRSLLVGLNRWFKGKSDNLGNPTGFKFGHPQISFIQVESSKAGSPFSIEGFPEETKPLQLRWIATDTKPTPTVKELRPRIAEDLADHVTILLNEGRIQDKDTKILHRVMPNDISILVRNHNDADPVVEALRSRGIAVVKSSIGSVLQTDAVDQLRTVLSAMAAPSDMRKVKAAALTWFFNYSFEDLMDERKIISLGNRLNDWAELLLDRGLVEFFQTLKADPEIVLELSQSLEVERRLTDLEHIIELLHREVEGKKVPASSVLRHLVELAADDNASDVTLRRIDTDAMAIQITTMHASKGLEFPIVLVPFPKGSSSRGPDVFTFEGQRYVDAAPDVDWTINDLNAATRGAISSDEIQGDDLRLMYVAFTRAKHQLVVWWAKSRGVESGPLARLLFGDHEEIAIKTKIPKETEVREIFDEIQKSIGVDEAGESLMLVREIPLENSQQIELKQFSTEAIESGSSAEFPANGQGRFGWGRWSYSSLAKAVKDHSIDMHGGGLDEIHAESISELVGDESNQTYETGNMFHLPASADFGTLVHEVLENVKFESKHLKEDLTDVLVALGTQGMSSSETDDLVNGLHDALDTPLDPILPGFRLLDVHSSDRLAEMDFHFSLNGGPVSTELIASLASREPNSLFADYFTRLSQVLQREGSQKIDGLMTGSIDILFRARIGADTKYFVADYKTNRLHKPSDSVPIHAYGFESMKTAMEANHYPLQAVFYCVALHRFLSSRLPDYEIDRDLGGSLYLFVRGMVGPQTPLIDETRNGVIFWRPASDTIVAIADALCSKEFGE